MNEPCACDAEKEADALLVTALDEVAWFLNLRGSDVSYNPVFLSYVMLTADRVTLYVDDQKARMSTPPYCSSVELAVLCWPCEFPMRTTSATKQIHMQTTCRR